MRDYWLSKLLFDWVAAHGAAGGRGFELIDYSPVPEVYVGCGFAAWDLGAARARG